MKRIIFDIECCGECPNLKDKDTSNDPSSHKWYCDSLDEYLKNIDIYSEIYHDCILDDIEVDHE